MKKHIPIFSLFAVLALAGCNLPINTPLQAATATRVVINTPIVIPPTVTQQVITQLPASTPLIPTIEEVVTATTAPQATTTSQPTATSTTATGSSSSGALRLQFANGGTAADVNNSVSANGKKQYLVSALANQTMILTLSTSTSDVYLTVTGNNGGQKLLTAISKAQTWKGVLPSTQDYLIEVVSAGSAAPFGLDVTIPARIIFSSGAVTGSYTGSIQSKALVTFLARASKNQMMTATLTSSNSDVLLTIYGLDDGQPLVRSVSGATTWTGKLPATQDYVIQAVSTGSATTFTLKLTIQ